MKTANAEMLRIATPVRSPVDSESYFNRYFDTISDKIRAIEPMQLEQCADMIAKVHSVGRKLLIMGNGGSAAMASHLCVDFVKTTGIRAMNFNEADLITCFGNDYGYEHWVEKAIEAYADEGDLAIIISSGGSSPNMVNAAHKARSMGLNLLTVSGFSPDNPLRRLGDINLWVNSSAYNIVEMTHHIWLLSIIDYLVALKDSQQ